MALWVDGVVPVEVFWAIRFFPGHRRACHGEEDKEDEEDQLLRIDFFCRRPAAECDFDIAARSAISAILAQE
jgi:hypothetical protein